MAMNEGGGKREDDTEISLLGSQRIFNQGFFTPTTILLLPLFVYRCLEILIR